VAIPIEPDADAEFMPEREFAVEEDYPLAGAR
jgi:hypothetical protein